MKSKKGFTIIEVVLVLAIAGLIFLMVFVALPNMQRNQRDTQRRQDYANLYANVTNYIANNKGTIPSSFSATDVNSNGTDPNGVTYSIEVKDYTATLNAPTGATIYVVKKAKCNGSELAQADGVRDYAVWGPLESGMFCQSTK